MDFKKWLEDYELMEISIKKTEYKPGALIPLVNSRNGGPEHMNIFKAQNPSRLVRSKPYLPIFRAGKGVKQGASTVINH